jgi:RNA polymerase sigma-70 factor (sigma-E family)
MDAFEDFVAARGAALVRTAYLICGDRAQAEDLVQNALARLLVHWRRIGLGDPEAYARKIIVNSTINWRQRLRARESVVDDLPERLTVDFTSMHAERDAMWRRVLELPARQRAVVVLRYYEDLTEAQTADVLGCSIGTVKSQHAKALAHLRRSADPATTRPNTLAQMGKP